MWGLCRYVIYVTDEAGMVRVMIKRKLTKLKSMPM